MDAARLYESPVHGRSPHGTDGVWSAPQVDQLIAVRADIRGRTAA
jgi:hypothetical protein